MPRWGTTKDENGCVHRLRFANRLNVVHSWQELVRGRYVSGAVSLKVSLTRTS